MTYEEYLKNEEKEAERLDFNDDVGKALYRYALDQYAKGGGNTASGSFSDYYGALQKGAVDSQGNYSYDMIRTLTDGGFYGDRNPTSYMTTYENGRIYVTGKNPEGYGNGGAGQTPTSTPSATSPMTYEQWMSSGGGDNSYAGQRKNATYAQAEAARTEAERLAEIERKRAVVDADTLEKQQRATYGQMAEQMGAMGLSGSGYSDYINSGAYAAGMAARQNANAKAVEAKQNASYAEYMAKLEADKQYATEKELAEKEAEALKRQYAREAAKAKAEEQTKYSNFINSIPEGATEEQIKSLAKLWGIDDTKAQNAADYVTKYSDGTAREGEATDKQKAAYQEVLSLIYNGLTAEDFDAATKYADLTEADRAALKAEAGRYNPTETETTPTVEESGYTTLDEIEKAAANLDITPEERDRYKAQTEATAKEKVQYQIDNGDLGTANSTADELYAADQLSEASYQEIKADLASRNINSVETIDEYNVVYKDLQKMLKKNQLTKVQYDKLVGDLTNKAKDYVEGRTISLDNVRIGSVINHPNMLIINGKTVSAPLPPYSAILDLYGTPTKSIMLDYNGEIYYYSTSASRWYRIKNDKVYENITNKK